MLSRALCRARTPLTLSPRYYMAVKFKGDLKTLIRDLETRGYRVRKAETVAGAAGRTADVFLDNGAVVQWDAYSQRVWADGPITESQRTETYLRCLYEGGVLGRIWVSSLWNLNQSAGFVRTKFLQVVRPSEKIAKLKSPSSAGPSSAVLAPAVEILWSRVRHFLKFKTPFPAASQTGGTSSLSQATPLPAPRISP